MEGNKVKKSCPETLGPSEVHPNVTLLTSVNPVLNASSIKQQYVQGSHLGIYLLSYIHFKLLNYVSADTALRKLELISMPC